MCKPLCSTSVTPLPTQNDSVCMTCRGGPPRWVDCLALRWEMWHKVSFTVTATRYCIESETKVSKLFYITNPALHQLSYVATSTKETVEAPL